ncbi:MFS transporter [Actinoallomurus spadix]|uniref:MFS transporter n=1 Tax=Actinoallomurus spadix TaxID=79912 RepID=A0ABN0VWV3_9ACTN|nr:MFS transporter [Actinoallomurus spadix]MCO5985920.1 MFS transporter [Actinoallomurus spadix]
MTRTPAKRRSLWRHRDFLLLWGGQTVSDVGSAVTVLALPLIAVSVLGASTFEVGVLSASGTVAYLLVALPAGALVDRTVKHRLMIWSNAGRAVVLAGVPFAAILGHLSMPQLYVTALIAGILTAVFEIAYQSYLPILLRRDQLVEGNGKIGITNSLSDVVGPSLAGGLVSLLGSAAYAVTADCVSFVVSIVSLVLIRAPDPPPRAGGPRKTIGKQIAEGFRYVAGHSVLRRVAACATVSSLFNMTLTTVLVVFLARTLHAHAETIGLVLGLGSAGGVAGAFAVGPLSQLIGSARMFWAGKLFLGGFALLIPFAGPRWGMVLVSAGLCATTAGVVMFNVSQVSYRQAVCPPELLGRMNATMRWAIRGAKPIGGLLGGVLGDWIGLRETLFMAALGSWLAVLFIVLSPIRRLRDIPVHEAYAKKAPQPAAP